MKIVVLDGYTLNPGDLSWDRLKQLGDVEIYGRTDPEDVPARIKGADIILINKVEFGKKEINQCSAKYLGVLATGYDIVDIKLAKEKGIVVTNIPTYGTNSVAQMAFAHILNIFNQVSLHNTSVKNGKWQNSSDWCYWETPLTEISGKTMGIIGYGKIGQATGRIAQAFGLKVLAYDTFKNPLLENENMRYAELDEIFRNADIISLHCPLLDSTRGIINKENLAKMKKTAVIINTARGDLVVEKDLADALNNGTIAAAGIDVVSQEPIRADNPLLHAKNIYITPHIAWATAESRERLLNMAVDNVKNYMEGHPQNVVNR